MIRLPVLGWTLLLALVLATLNGCARGGENAPVGPQVVVDFTLRLAGPINDSFYYFIPLDTDGDFGLDGPLPVAAGPFWQNGWGTGSFTHYLEYHLGQYTLYQVVLQPSLTTPGGGLTAATGATTGADAGTHTVTVGTPAYGTVTVAGTGMVTAVANNALQSAGVLALETNAAGQVVAGTVTFTPATTGGRALTASEQAVVANLNVGGVALQGDSLAGLGVTLTLGAPAAGAQTLTVAPTTALAQDSFVVQASGQNLASQLTLMANATNTVGLAPQPTAGVTTGDLVAGGLAVLEMTLAPTGRRLGPPYDFTLPRGGSTLQATLDLESLGTNLADLSVNMITTNELIYDPTITDPNQHTYDGLGALGNRYVTFRTSQFQTINNSSGLFEQEMGGDSTLIGPTTQNERNAVDIVDWSITIRRLR